MSILSDESEVPLGLGLALATNPYSMSNFAAMTNEQKQEVINRAQSVKSKAEMEAFVSTLSVE